MSRFCDARSSHGRLVVLLTMLLSCYGRVAPGGGGTAAAADAHRLPGNTRPLSYELTMRPNYDRVRETVEFEGEVKITVSVSSATCTVTLNCRDLDVRVAYVYEKRTESSLGVETYTYDDANEQLTISLMSLLNVGVEYVLDVEFYGRVDNGSNGFYKSSYGRKEWLLPTYIGPTGARRIFPCYDEPVYKTPFKISLLRPRDKSARSNMPKSTVSKMKSDDDVLDVFFETPPMSTHQVAFIVSSFDRVSTTGDLAINVFARPGCSDQIRNVVNEAPLLLKAMEDFTEVQYELPVLDLFAVPDLKSDAMGNWGLNTYREKFLLLDDTSSAKAVELGLSTIQRQMAHQWFGNLVTCSWWDYLWLHDAFATYFQYFTTHSVHPDWRMDEVFVIEQHQSALAHDQTADRDPITVAVRFPVEIDRAFYDVQTSRKAAAFLRMLKSTMNDTIFQQSLVRYLKRNKYGSAKPDQLYEAFELTLTEYQFDFGYGIVTVTDFMRQWTEQKGYPAISVTKVNGSFIVTQERFLIDTCDNVTDSSKWTVGVTYTTESRKDFKNLSVAVWCKPLERECVLPAPEDPGWFIFNVQSTGLYRVNYDGENWSLLIRQLKVSPSDIHVFNRAQLIDDSFNLARGDALHYSIPLELSSYLKKEEDVLPWYSFINSYSYVLERMRRNETEYLELKMCVNNLADVIYKKVEDLIIKQNNTDHTILTSWNAFSVWACGLDNNMCIQSAFEYYKKWQNGEKIPTDIRDAAFCVGIHITNDTITWEQMFEIYKTTKSPSEKQSAQTALACTENDKLLSRYLNYMLIHEDGPIRTQDYKDVIIAVSSTPKGLNVLIDFLVQNVNNFREQIVDGDDIAIFMYSICASKSSLENEIIRIKNLKNSQTIPENLKIAFNELYHQVENNLYWYNKYHQTVRENTDCYYRHTTTDDPRVSSTQTYSQSTTEYSTSTETSTSFDTSTTEYRTTTETPETITPINISTSTEYSTSAGTGKSTGIPSTTEGSTPIETTTSTGFPSTTEYSTPTETTTSTSFPLTTEGSTPMETTTSIGFSSTTEYSIPVKTTTSTSFSSTTEYSTPTETTTSTGFPSTTEYSTLMETTTSTDFPSTTKGSTPVEATTSTSFSSTIEYSTPTETTTSTSFPLTTEGSTPMGTTTSTGFSSTTEYSTLTETTTSTDFPPTTKGSTPVETTTSTSFSSTIEYSTPTETTTSTGFSSTTEYSTPMETSISTVFPSSTEGSTPMETTTSTGFSSTTEGSTSMGTTTSTDFPSTTKGSTPMGTTTSTDFPSTTKGSTPMQTTTSTGFSSTTEYSLPTDITTSTSFSSTTEYSTPTETTTSTGFPSTTEYSTLMETTTSTDFPSTTKGSTPVEATTSTSFSSTIEYSTPTETTTSTSFPLTTEGSTPMGTTTSTGFSSTTEYSTLTETTTSTDFPPTTKGSTPVETTTSTSFSSTIEYSTPTETTTSTGFSSTTEYSTPMETSISTVFPSSTEGSTPMETTTSTGFSSTTEGSTSMGTTTFTDFPSTTKGSTPMGTTTSTDFPSTTKGSTPMQTTTSTGFSSTTEYSLPTDITTSTSFSSTIEYSTPVETTSSTGFSSTTEYSTPMGTTTSTDFPSTTKGSTPVETTTSTGFPSTTEYSTPMGTTTSTDFPSTTKGSTLMETTSSTGFSSTTEYSTPMETSTSTGIPSTTKESSIVTEILGTTTSLPSASTYNATKKESEQNSTTPTKPLPLYESTTVTSSIDTSTISDVSPLPYPFDKSSHYLYSCLVFLVIILIFSIIVSVLCCYGPNTKHINQKRISMSSP